MTNTFFYFNLILRSLFVVIGIFVCTGYFLNNGFEPAIRYAIGGVMIVYGGFRLYQLFSQRNSDKNETPQ